MYLKVESSIYMIMQRLKILCNLYAPTGTTCSETSCFKNYQFEILLERASLKV